MTAVADTSQGRQVLQDIVEIGLAAAKSYNQISMDGTIWQIPERWLQVCIANEICKKHSFWLWLELPISKILEWKSNNPDRVISLEGDRTTGQVDIALFPKDSEFVDLCGVIELKRLITRGTECVDDWVRINEINKLFSGMWGIVGGPFYGDESQIRKEMLGKLNIASDSIISKFWPGSSDYGFIAALTSG